MRLYTLEQFVDGRWVVVKEGLSAALGAFAGAVLSRDRPDVPWRAVRDDGVVLNP